jgi:hypothetical protein
MNPNNPVVKLCVEGMKAEGEERYSDARLLFMQAWEARLDGFDACVAAHYVARHQDTLEDILYWNEEALRYAESVEDDKVETFYPSLYFNLGKSNEQLGNQTTARHFYKLAAGKLNLLTDGTYGDRLRRGIELALERTSRE